MAETGNKKYLRILYLPSVEGQVKLWKNIFDKEAAASDEVYQFGNLIGLSQYAADETVNRGNNQDILIAIASRIKLGRWNQLVGPNEIVALNAPDKWTNQKSRKILRDLWLGETPMKVAVGVRGRLLSHGGLTYGEWIDLGKPSTAQQTAKLLNEKYMGKLFQGSSYLLGSAPNYSANPIWAHPSRELYPSWLTAPEALPFDQVTGGGSLNEPEGRALVRADESIYTYADKIRYHRYGSKIEIKGQRIISLGLALEDTPMTSLSEDRQLYVERLELSKENLNKPF